MSLARLITLRLRDDDRLGEVVGFICDGDGLVEHGGASECTVIFLMDRR